MLYYWNRKAKKTTHVAFINRGAIRADLVAGEITGEDIINVLPFRDEVYRVELTGKALKYMLQCRLMQWSGLRVAFKAHTGLPGQIDSAYIRCNPDRPEEWCILKDDNQMYGVTIARYLLQSSRPNCDFKDHIEGQEMGPSDFEVFQIYLEEQSPLESRVEGRLIIMDDRGKDGKFVKELWKYEDKLAFQAKAAKSKNLYQDMKALPKAKKKVNVQKETVENDHKGKEDKRETSDHQKANEGSTKRPRSSNHHHVVSRYFKDDEQHVEGKVAEAQAHSKSYKGHDHWHNHLEHKRPHSDQHLHKNNHHSNQDTFQDDFSRGFEARDVIETLEKDETVSNDFDISMVYVFLTYLLWIPVFALAWYAVCNKRSN